MQADRPMTTKNPPPETDLGATGRPNSWDPIAELGFPGEFPYTRGIQPTMYRGRLWTLRQYAGFGTAAESNQRYRYLIAQGVTGLSVAFDLPTQMGYDSDHPLASGEVGRVGVAIDSIEDMAELLDAIPLDRVSTSMTINATSIVLLALYAAVARSRGIPLTKLSGTVQNDILKEYVARGTYIYPPRPSLRIVTDIFAFCEREMPNWNTISISGYHIREAGSTAVEEVAFTFANAIAYVEASMAAGLDANRLGRRLSFFFNAHNNFLEEIAKFRAARRLWARIMRERFGVTNPRAEQLRFHTQTAGSTLTAQQPDNNIVRVALQALAAVLGGTQSLHCNGRDEALALPTEESARIALRTQQIIAAETGVANTVDPVGGSFAIETLTDSIEQGARALLERIDAAGGTLAAIDQGLIQRAIQESAYRAQQAVDAGATVVVGVNAYQTDDTARIDVLSIDPAIESRQVERVRRVRAARDGSAWREAIDAVTTADDCTQLRLTPLEGDARRQLSILTPFDRPAPLHIAAGSRVVSRRRWLHEIDRRLISLHPFGSLSAAARASIRLLPYQLEPAIAVMRFGACRLLITDGVGQGKTIQAGLILSGLAAATESFRALVLVPAGLRNQWIGELSERFQLPAIGADAEWLRRSALDRPPDVNPWMLPGIYVASHDFVKRAEALRPLERAAWDVVIIDEAHLAGATTDRRAALDAVASRALRVVMLTATPNPGDPAAL